MARAENLSDEDVHPQYTCHHARKDHVTIYKEYLNTNFEAYKPNCLHAHDYRLPFSSPVSNRDVVTPKANPRLSNGTKSGIKGHIAAEAKANPKEMRTKPTSQLKKGPGSIRKE